MKMINKTSIIFLILLVLGSIRLSGQKGIDLKYGLMGGSSYYLVDKSDLITVTNNNNNPEYLISIDKAKLGIHFGIFAQLRLNKIILRPEVIFNSNTIDYKVKDLVNASGTQIVHERYQHIDIPLLLGYKSGIIKFLAGPSGKLFINNKSELVDINNFSTNFKKVTFGYQAGLGIDLYNFMLDLRYEGSFAKIGEGIMFGDKQINFAKNTGRLILNLSFAIK